MALKGVEIEPEPVKLGGHYYRVTAWDKARPGLPTVPDVDKAVWRKHNLYEDDIIETTEPLAGLTALDIDKEGIPANGVGNWTVADFKGVQRDEEAYKPFKLNAHKVKNHCVGILTYDEFQALKFYTEQKKDSVKLSEFQAAADLKAIAEVMPWGEAFSKGAPVVGLDGRLLTTARIAEKWLAIIPAPAPKCLDRAVSAMYGVDVGERLIQDEDENGDPVLVPEKPPLKPVGDTVDLFAECRTAKVPGWSPTNAYVGTAIYSNTSATGAGVRDLRNDTGASRKIGQQFTTVGAFNLCSLAISIHKHEAADGNLNGELTIRIADGSTVGSGSNGVAYVVSALEVPKTTSAYIHFGGTVKALAATTAYNFWVEYSGTTDANNYLSIDFNTQISTGDEYDYDGAAWNAQTGKDLKCYLCDDAIGGKGIVRADAAGSVFFAAAGPRGTAFDTTATYTVTMGATLTRDSNVTVLQGRQGDTVTGAQAYAVQGAIGAASATYRYGYEVVNAGVTVTWTGNANGSISGWLKNPTTADASSKGCSLTLNGTSGSKIKVTNAGDANSTSERWACTNTYGPMVATHVKFYFSNSGIAGTYWSFAANSANTSGITTLTDCYLEIVMGGNQSWVSLLNIDTRINFINLVWNSGQRMVATSGTPVAGGEIYLENLTVQSGSAAITMTLVTGVGWYQSGALWAVSDVLFSRATPADLALADTGTGRTLKATVAAATIAALADNDLLVFYNSSNAEIGRITKAAYVAALYSKDANCALLTGLVDGTTYTGVYCKSTRDSILFSAASGTASGTPTLSASYASYVTLENSRNNDNGTVAADIIAPATVKIRNTTITGTAKKFPEILSWAGISDVSNAGVASVQVGEAVRLVMEFQNIPVGTAGHLLIQAINGTTTTVVDKDITIGADQSFADMNGAPVQFTTLVTDTEGTYFSWTLTLTGFETTTGTLYFAVTDFPTETDVLDTAPAYQFGTRTGEATGGGGGSSESSGSESSASESTASSVSGSSYSASSLSGVSSSSSSESGEADWVNEWETYIRVKNETLTPCVATRTKSATGAVRKTYTPGTAIYCDRQQSSPRVRAQYAERQLVVNFAFFVAEAPGMGEGDRFLYAGKYYLVHGIDEQDAGKLWRIDAEGNL